jgi:hypothetical protein
MTEGKGYVGRRQEQQNLKQISEFIENKDKIFVIFNRKK